MMYTLFLVAVLINSSFGTYYKEEKPCVDVVKDLTITNTWADIEYDTITKTALEHHHTMIPVTNTIIVPTTTLSTLTVTWIEPGKTETSVSIVKHTSLVPVTNTAIHTVVKTKSVDVKAIEVEVTSMTLTQTIIKPYTSTYTTTRYEETVISTYSKTTTTVTDWKTVTTKKPTFVTWTNFKTFDVEVTKTILKNQYGVKHVSTTVTEHTTLVTKCY